MYIKCVSLITGVGEGAWGGVGAHDCEHRVTLQIYYYTLWKTHGLKAQKLMLNKYLHTAETGVDLRDRTVTDAICDRSVPVRHTCTSKYPSLSSTWYSGSVK